MNIKIIDEQQHNKLYDDWIWIERQIVKQLSINKTSCPKEEKVMYTEKPVYLKVFNETYGLIGGFTLPKALEVVYDRFKEGEMVIIKKTDTLNQFMFPKELFSNNNAVKMRKKLCKGCLCVECNYNPKYRR